MISPNEIFTKIVGNKLNICHTESDTIIAQIDRNRKIDMNQQFISSLEQKTIEKIDFIARNYDDGYQTIEISGGAVDHRPDIQEVPVFVRLMNERPEININDVVILQPLITIPERNNSRFRIMKIYKQDIHEKDSFFGVTGIFVDMVDINDHKLFETIHIEHLILAREYQPKWYYIQNGYIGNSMYWWATDSKGYTTDIRKAHKFTEEEAMSILRNNEKDKRRNERVWDAEYIDNSPSAHVTIIDSQFLENHDTGLLTLSMKVKPQK